MILTTAVMDDMMQARFFHTLSLLASLILYSTRARSADSSLVDFQDDPKNLLAACESAKSIAPDSHTYYLKYVHTVEVINKEFLKSTRYRQICVRNPESVEYWNKVEFYWRKWFQERPTIRLRVIDPQGTVSELDQKTLVESAVGETSTKMFSDAAQLIGLPPKLVPGSVLEYAIETRDFAHVLGDLSWLDLTLEGPFPYQDSHTSFTYPEKSNWSFKTFFADSFKQSESSKDGFVKVEFRRKDSTAVKKFENYLPSSEVRDTVLMIANRKSWQDMVEDYSKVIAKQQVSEKSLDLIYQKAIGKAADKKSRINAIISFVHNSLRYNSLALERSGYVPRTPDEVMSRGYGDCKDKAWLAVKLLEKAGIEAYLALVNSDPSEKFEDSMPSFGQFDHAIVYLPREDDHWIDATASGYALGYLPTTLIGRQALPIKAGIKKPLIVETGKDASFAKSELREYHMQRLKNADVKVTVGASGPNAGALRNWLRNQADLTKGIRTFEGLAAEAVVADISSSSSTDYTVPAQLSYTIKDAPDLGHNAFGTTLQFIPRTIFDSLRDLINPLRSGKSLGDNLTEMDKFIEDRTRDILIGAIPKITYRRQYFMPASFVAQAIDEPYDVKLGPLHLKFERKPCGPHCEEFSYVLDEYSKQVWTAQEYKDYLADFRQYASQKSFTVNLLHEGHALELKKQLKDAILKAKSFAEAPDADKADKFVYSAFLAKIGLTEQAHQQVQSLVADKNADPDLRVGAIRLMATGFDGNYCSLGGACQDYLPLLSELYAKTKKNDILLLILNLSSFNAGGIGYGDGYNKERLQSRLDEAKKVDKFAEIPGLWYQFAHNYARLGKWDELIDWCKKAPADQATLVNEFRNIAYLGLKDFHKMPLDSIDKMEDKAQQLQSMIRSLLALRRYDLIASLNDYNQGRLPINTASLAKIFAGHKKCRDLPKKSEVESLLCLLTAPELSPEEFEKFLPPEIGPAASIPSWVKDEIDSARTIEDTLSPYFMQDLSVANFDLIKTYSVGKGRLLKVSNSRVSVQNPTDFPETQQWFYVSSGKQSDQFLPIAGPTTLAFLAERLTKGDVAAKKKFLEPILDLIETQISLSEKFQKGKADDGVEADDSLLPLFAAALKDPSLPPDLILALISHGEEAYEPALLKKYQALDKDPKRQRLWDIKIAAQLLHSGQSKQAWDLLEEKLLKAPLRHSELGQIIYYMIHTAKEPVPKSVGEKILRATESVKWSDRHSLNCSLLVVVENLEGPLMEECRLASLAEKNGIAENFMAWYYFIQNKELDKGLEQAQLAAQYSRGKRGIIHTLASLQFAKGLPDSGLQSYGAYMEKSQRVLGRTFAQKFTQGLIAESFGLKEIARDIFTKMDARDESLDLRLYVRKKALEYQKSKP